MAAGNEPRANDAPRQYGAASCLLPLCWISVFKLVFKWIIMKFSCAFVVIIIGVRILVLTCHFLDKDVVQLNGKGCFGRKSTLYWYGNIWVWETHSSGLTRPEWYHRFTESLNQRCVHQMSEGTGSPIRGNGSSKGLATWKGWERIAVSKDVLGQPNSRRPVGRLPLGYPSVRLLDKYLYYKKKTKRT